MTTRERGMAATKCWDCKKAVGLCSWSDGSFRPVEGWAALPTRYLAGRDGREVIESYCVYVCPEFEQDEVRVENDTE